MRAILLGVSFILVVAVAACNEPGRGPMQQSASVQPAYTPPLAPQSVPTATETADPFIGVWSGTLPSGAAVQITIPANGISPIYYFRGESQPMGTTEMRGQTLRVNFAPAGNGYIDLTPQADGRMIYFFNRNQTTANLVLTRM
jgi:hypothetical protein